MRRTRVIPVLLLHQGGVYKTTKFKKPIYIGDPINAIRLFNDLEVDEIIVLDIDASKNNSLPDFEMIEELASEAFMPFAYGGGIGSIEQARSVFNCGIEKVVLNYFVQENTDLISRCAAEMGSQSIVASIDYKKKMFGGIKRYNHVSDKVLADNAIDAAVCAERAGAGEIMLTSVDRDGLMTGFDVETIQSISQAVTVPVVACGGAGSLEHMKVAQDSGASALAAGSMFVFHGKQRGVLINYPTENLLREYLN